VPFCNAPLLQRNGTAAAGAQYFTANACCSSSISGVFFVKKESKICKDCIHVQLSYQGITYPSNNMSDLGYLMDQKRQSVNPVHAAAGAI
jgi:hypothetical protein